MYRVATLFAMLAFVAYGNSAFVTSMNRYIDDCLQPGKNPVALANTEVKEEGSFLVTKEDTIRIPNIGFSESAITCISVINLETDDDGGYVSILAGGVGSLYVTLYMKSQLGKGYDFQVSIYYNNSTEV